MAMEKVKYWVWVWQGVNCLDFLRAERLKMKRMSSLEVGGREER